MTVGLNITLEQLAETLSFSLAKPWKVIEKATFLNEAAVKALVFRPKNNGMQCFFMKKLSRIRKIWQFQ